MNDFINVLIVMILSYFSIDHVHLIRTRNDWLGNVQSTKVFIDSPVPSLLVFLKLRQNRVNNYDEK